MTCCLALLPRQPTVLPCHTTASKWQIPSWVLSVNQPAEETELCHCLIIAMNIFGQCCHPESGLGVFTNSSRWVSVILQCQCYHSKNGRSLASSSVNREEGGKIKGTLSGSGWSKRYAVMVDAEATLLDDLTDAGFTLETLFTYKLFTPYSFLCEGSFHISIILTPLQTLTSLLGTRYGDTVLVPLKLG